jgi:hypothetical protein
MTRIEKTVFISYRRTNLPWALFVYQNLTMHGYDVFFDYLSIPSGDFEEIIIGNIKARAHFLIVLTPSALERCNEPDDWFRKEIETAIEHKRNIVPLLMEGFDFGVPNVEKNLTGRLSELPNFSGLSVPSDFAEEAMERLRQKFLNLPLEISLHPYPKSISTPPVQGELNSVLEPIKVTAIGTVKNSKKTVERPLRVFLCHAKEDKPIAREFYKRLTGDGFDAWLDEEKLLPGQDWDIEIEKAVQNTDAVIVFLSDHSVTKEGYIQKELKYVLYIAQEKPEGTIFVIPIRLSECQVPLRVRSWQYLDYFPTTREDWAYNKLLQSLNLRAQSISSN